MCYPKCPRLGLDFPRYCSATQSVPRLGPDFPHIDHTDGLDASGNFISDAGTLFPIALCGQSVVCHRELTRQAIAEQFAEYPYWSSRIFAPFPLISKQCVGHDDQLSHDGCDRQLLAFSD